MIGVHNQRRGDAGAPASLGFAGVPLARWPMQTSRLIDAEQRQETEYVDSAMPAGSRQDEQAALRYYAATLLSEESTETANSAVPVASPVPSDRISPFTMAAMLLLAGCIFLVVIPPVGVTFLLCAVLPLIWGAGTAALGSS